MGSWASGSFENDTALDWLTELYERRDVAIVRVTLECAAKSPPVGPLAQMTRVGDEQRAVAAADIIACWLGHPPPEPKRAALGEWVRTHLASAPDLVPLARDVVAVIKQQSQLRTAWTDREGVVSGKWLDSMSDLERRLQS
jgi:hypothetical protein